MFQLGSYCGGFDATEGEFVFGVMRGSVEYWFQFPLETAARIAAGESVPIEARPADT
ncbi:MAG: hypothetical protein AAFQ82_19835 [Myxococcota bacterium]